MGISNTKSGALPIYVPAGGIGDPYQTTKVSGEPKGSSFASTTSGVLSPDQSSGPVRVVHAGLDVTQDAKLGLKMFDQIKHFRLDVSPATEALMMKDLFFRRFEARNATQTVMPPAPMFDQFVFPRNAAWHYVSTDGVSVGPEPLDPRLRETKKRTLVSNVKDLTSHVGNPIPIVFNFQSETDKWFRQTRAYRRSRDAVADASNENLLPIVNYAWLNKAYRYTRSIYTERYRWENIWRTAFDKVYEYLDKGDTHTHFMFVEMPQTLTSIGIMQGLIDKPVQSVIRRIRDERQWMIFEMWKWIDPATRASSMLNVFRPEMFDKLRIVIVDSGRFTVFNPSSIDRWTVDPSRPRDGATVMAQQMQRRFVRGLMSLMEHRKPPAELGSEYNEELAGPDEDDNSQVDVVDPAKSQTLPVTTGQEQEGQEEQEGSVLDEDAPDPSSTITQAEMILQTMDEDLNALEVIGGNGEFFDDDDDALAQTVADPSKKVIDGSIVGDAQANEPAKSSFDAKVVLTDILGTKVNKLADQGAITAAEYRKLRRLIEQSKELPSAYASGASMVDFGAVKTTDTELGPKSVLASRSTVSDPTMLGSTLEDFDSKYIKEILPRDVTAMLVGVQAAGFIVTSHEVEVVEDAMTAYEYHTVKYQPIEGQLSTLRFKIPVVSPSGRVKSSGTESILRKQRVDLPICKISPSRVSLSSYYGKQSISLNERSAYNYDSWMQKELLLKSIGEGATVSHLQTGDSFDHMLKTPRAYSALSHSYRSFEHEGVLYGFDKKTRDKLFKPELYEILAQDGLWPVGRKGEEVYALDNDNTLYLCKPGDNQPLDAFDRYLDFSDNKPLEHAVARIFAKDVPVGLLLGYYFGMGEVLKMLGVTPRRVMVGTRQNLQPDEWSLVFEDQAIVFSRADRLATLIFGGMKKQEKCLKQFSIYAFDRPEVYYNVLEFMGLSGRYLREFDNLRALFVDPITERVLVKMKEPTTYTGLVKRACELLLTSYHARKMDMREMRIRGTERIAGAVYTEITRAIREQSAKASKSSARVELHPFAIWNTVMRDTAMTQVKDINPINSLKEREAVTFSGEGGRAAQTMMRGDRVFDPTDMGMISEASPDSGDVGVSTYLVGVPRFANLEGMILEPQFENTEASSLLSTSALVSPASTNDD